MNLRRAIKHLRLVDLFLVGIIVLFGIVFFLFFYRKAEYVNIRVKVTDQEVLYARTLPENWYAGRFRVGDAEKDVLGKKITEITGIQEYPVTSKQKAVYLDLKVKATYDTRTKMYSARGKTLVFGTPMRFYLNTVTFDGIVTEYPGSDYDFRVKIGYREADVVVRAFETWVNKPVEPEVLAQVKPGDKVTDRNGQVLAEVLQVNLFPAVWSGPQNLNISYYKDARLRVKVLVKNIDGSDYVLDNLPFKPGETLPLVLPNITLMPTIISIY